MTDDAEQLQSRLHGDRRWFTLAAVGTFLTLALQYKLHWTPGGDSDFFVSVARNLARGDGYTYNGEGVAISPPGWPWFLSGLMRVMPDFAFLNLVQSLLLWAGLLLFYPLCRALTGPPTAAVAVLVTAFLHPVYPLAGWMHSEPLYLVLVNAAVWAGLSYSRVMGRNRWLWIAAATLIAIVGITVRWTGLFHWLLVASALLSGVGHRRPMSIGAARLGPTLAAGLIVAGAFQWLFTTMKVTTDLARPSYTQVVSGEPEQIPTPTQQLDGPATLPGTLVDPAGGSPLGADNLGGVGADGSAGVAVQEALGHGDFLADGRSRSQAAEYASRLSALGTWTSWLLWYPSRFASGLGTVSIAVGAVGWVALGFYAVGWHTLGREGRWLAGGVLAYVVVIALVWPNPNARYLVPVAPLFLIVVMLGLRRLGKLWPIAMVTSVLLANLPLYLVDAYLSRVPGAATVHYEAGDAASLAAACQVLRDADISTGDVVVSERYVNFGRVRRLRTGSRSAQVLLDVDIRAIPRQVPDVPESPALARHLKSVGASYYFFQEPAVPWRLWHVRMPMWLQTRLSNDPVARSSGGWELYQLDRSAERPRLVRVPVEVDDTFRWPRRVPGL